MVTGSGQVAPHRFAPQNQRDVEEMFMEHGHVKTKEEFLMKTSMLQLVTVFEHAFQITVGFSGAERA
jgi:hypothetical protein